MPEHGTFERATIAGVILAGGLSRRMGGIDKSLIELNGVPLVARARNRLAPQVARIVISANGDPVRYSSFCLPVVADTVPGHAGPLAGILAAMAWARPNLPDATHVLSAPADTPFFPADLGRRLAEAADAHGKIALAASNGSTHQAFGLWPLALYQSLEAFLAGGGRKVMEFAAAHDWTPVGFPFIETREGPVDPFFNINTPQDLERGQALAALLP
jgi:molybdenum cofactor guanylyltransferase